MTKMLNEGDEAEITVLWNDQHNINQFSKFNNLATITKDALAVKINEKEYLDDLLQELELADEDDLVKYRIGGAFVSISLEECQERLLLDMARVTEQISTLQNTISNAQRKMESLKVDLYAKFGKSINLEA